MLRGSPVVYLVGPGIVLGGFHPDILARFSKDLTCPTKDGTIILSTISGRAGRMAHPSVGITLAAAFLRYESIRNSRMDRSLDRMLGVIVGSVQMASYWATVTGARQSEYANPPAGSSPAARPTLPKHIHIERG
jgi:hypothetical protein